MNTRKVLLEEVITDIAAGPFGSNLKVSCFVESGFPIIDGANLKGYKLTDNLTKFVTEEKARSLSRSIAKQNDVVVTISGTLGQIAYIPYDSQYKEYLCSQRQFRVTFDTDRVYVPYLVFYFHSYEGQHKILSFANQTGVPALSQPLKNFKRIEVDLPDIDTQKRIASVIEIINSKVEKNNEINENLAEQADALYQAFFSPKSGTQGKNVTLDEYCSIFTGKKNANASVEGGKYKFFTCAPESLLIDSYIYDGNAIIVSGNGAYTGRTRFYSGKFDLYQRTYACTLLDGIDPDYIFPLYWFVKLELSKKIMGGTRGSAIPYIVMNDLAKFEFIYNEETFVKYMPIFKDLTETIQANEFENEHLSELRDTLLPRLMSGELDVSELDL